MKMELDNVKQHLTDKVNDYKRFSFILISLSIFMFIGLLIPSEQKMMSEVPLIVVSILLLGLSFTCHRISMKSKQKLEEDHEC